MKALELQKSANMKVMSENNDFMKMQMMKFCVWCENILSQISNHRSECSIFVLIYVLAQIAFCTFCYDENENENAKRALSEIQSRALLELDRIEKESENEEIEK